MEEDEEFIKKLMNMLGSGRQLKFKANGGQTIRVTLDGSSNYETQQSSSKHTAELESPPQHSQLPSLQADPTDHVQCKQSEDEPFFSESLQQISYDFNTLSHAHERTTLSEGLFNEDNFDSMIIMDLQKLKEKESCSSIKTEDHVVKEFINQIETNQEEQIKKEEEPKRADKPKKISLANKSNKTSNSPVLDFFRDQHHKPLDSSEIKQEKSNVLAANSSPTINRGGEKEELGQKSHSKSEQIQENITLLRERHPEEQKTFEMISERLQQLQQKSKMVDQSLSIINSSSISMKLDSFDVSVLSLQKNSDDPLCFIMSQFLNRAKLEITKGKSKSIPSSFLFMFSQPLISSKGKEIEEQINYFEEEQIIQKTLKEGKCKVDYIHEPATVQKLHFWIKQGLQILHFCGHGVNDAQKKGNYLLFQNQRGQSGSVTSAMLTDLLKEGVQSLKLVFVASCHSESAGKVFAEAGVSHVICIRDDYQILDQACQQFVKLFYLTCINSKTTICQSFYFAKKQLELKGKFTKHQCQKFIIIKDHNQEKCSHYFQHRNQLQAFNDLNPQPFYSKYLLSRVEHYIPRCRDLYQIVKLVGQKRRFITITGQSGIGKSTLVRQMVRYVQFRNFFKDGIVYLELSRCQNMSKIYEVLDLELFQTPQLKLNKSPAENVLRLAKQLSDKNLMVIFDNCQHIMASEEKDSFKKLTESLMKTCKDLCFIFTNRHSIGRQIDYCSEVQYELGRLTISQAKTLFFSKIPRSINKQEMDDFFHLDRNCKEISEHSFFTFLNGHPQAICMTASLVAYRSLKELYEMLMKPSISREMNQSMTEEDSCEGINKVVSTAIRISLNVINHKYKEASEMVKILSLLPNGLQSEMMSKVFPQGNGKWRETVKKLMTHSLVQCIEKGGSKYFLLHPHIIVEVEKEMNLDQKIKYHQRICEQLVKKIKKIYEHVGTLSQYSQRAQQIFLFQQDNYKTVLLRELSFVGERHPLRKFYENVFKVQFQGLDEEGQNDIGDLAGTTAQILANYQKNKKVKSIQLEKTAQKKEPIDIFIVYYITILFVVKKVKNTSIEAFLNYGIIIAHKKNKYLVFANLLRIKACTLMVKSDDAEAKTFFGAARSQFAQLGCGLGSACCEAALGYIKYCEHEYASAKMNLQNALKYYDEIPHAFGKHYLNRWLCSLKSKMNREEKELITHKLEAQKLLKEAKSNLRANNLNNISIVRHKLGSFPFRFLFDNISLFLEATFEVDLRPKFINPTSVSALSTNIFKDSKKNNFILDEINEQSNIVPVGNHKADLAHSMVISQTKTTGEPIKRKEPIRRMQKKKVERPLKQLTKESQKVEKVERVKAETVE